MPNCPTSGYSPNSNRCSCDFCLEGRARWQREYRKRKPELLRRMNLRKYGISLEDFNQMYKDQKGVCAVCKKPEADKNQHNIMSLSVDHDHETGKVRGLLCHRCNRALGLLNDDLDNVRELFNYRKRND